MMKYILSTLFISALTLITTASAFADCPDPKQISYKHKPFEYVWFSRWLSRDGQWSTAYTNMTYPTAPATPEINFESVAILTGRGQQMPDRATPHVRCIYRVKDYGLIILRDNSFKYHSTFIDNQYKAWKYIPFENGPTLGEWRCSKSIEDCRFK